MGENWVIDQKGALPWHLPGDLAGFKKRTMGKPIIMGRRTFDTIQQPLPGRTNIVLTRQAKPPHPKVQVATNLAQAYALAEAAIADKDDRECMIVGGADIYALTLPHAHRLYMTLVHSEPAGDLCFPNFDRDAWQVKAVQQHPKDDRHSHAWSEFTLERKEPCV